MRVLALSVFCLALGCGPSQPPVLLGKQVGWSQLVAEYRDHREQADRDYTDQPIQIYLPARSYKCGPNRIEAYHGLFGTPGALVFECKPPADSHSPLLVTGVCRGLTRDGIERANGIDWYVRVESCTITTLGQ